MEGDPLDSGLEDETADGEPVGEIVHGDAIRFHFGKVYTTLFKKTDWVFVLRVILQVKEKVELPGADTRRVDFYFLIGQKVVMVRGQRQAKLDGAELVDVLSHGLLLEVCLLVSRVLRGQDYTWKLCVHANNRLFCH